MWIWQEARERWLLVCVAAVFGLVCLVNARLPLWDALEGGLFAAFLCAEATANVASDLLVGLISAYVFYVIIELLPSHRKKTETLRVLNLLVASVVDAFERTGIFAHETPINSIDLHVLDLSNLQSHIEALKGEPEFLQLKFAMETAHSRYQDFQHALSLAVALSPEHALDWLVLTDKMRLLAQEYDTYPIDPLADVSQNPNDPRVLEGHMEYLEKMDDLTSTLIFRISEVFEAAVIWRAR